MTTANTKLNVLVACESSGTVRDAFRKLGHNAWSCDLLPCDADPTYHVQSDVLSLLQRDGSNMFCAVNQWDLLVAHPPCTYLCNSGVRWLYEWDNTLRPAGRQIRGVHLSGMPPYGPTAYQYRNEHRWHQMRTAANFFLALWHAGIPHVAVENPVMHRHARACGIPRQTQVIQPYQFGHPESKATCLWLRGLPKLVPTNIVPATNDSALHKLPPSKDQWKLRSKTYSGIADAIAAQWSAHLLNLKGN